MDPLRTKQYDHDKGNTKPCVCIFHRTCRTPLKTESRHDANFVFTGSTAGCHNDILRCHQWRRTWHYDNSRFSVTVSVKLVDIICSILRDLTTDFPYECFDNFENGCVCMQYGSIRGAMLIYVLDIKIYKTDAICKIIETFNDECPQFWNQQEPYRILPMW